MNHQPSKYPDSEPAVFSFREEPSISTDKDSSSLTFDLEERTAQFGEAIIRLAKRMPQSPVNKPIIEQIVACGTSIGANYCEASDAVSKKEFQVKIAICKKEARETKFFLRMIATAEPDLIKEARNLWHEARQLHLIFCKIFRSCKKQQ